MCSQQCVGVQVKTLNCWLRSEFSRPPKFTLLTVVFNIIVIKYVLQFIFCSCHLCFPTVLASGLDVGSVFEIYVCLIGFCAKVEISAVSTLYWDPFRY